MTPAQWPALTGPQIKLLLATLRLAWQALLENPGPHGIKNLHQAKEVEISDALLRILNVLYNDPLPEVADFPEMFERPIGDASALNFDRTKHGRPDFTIRPKKGHRLDSQSFGVFVEAKLVKGGELSNYMRTGLHRYLCGDYGWGMRQGLMIGYVRPISRDSLVSLRSFFQRHGNAVEFGLRGEPKRFSGDRHRWPAFVSTHSREVVRRPISVGTDVSKGASVADIEIVHLWLYMA